MSAPEPSMPPGMPPLDLNGTIGALLLGGIITAIMYGITCTQTVVYYQHSQRDSWMLKTAVAVLWALDTFDMALIGHILYYYLVTNYGNPESLQVPVWSIILHLFITTATEDVVRSMFSTRVWKLSGGNRIPAVIVGIATLADFVTGIILTTKAWGKTFAQLNIIQGWIYANFVTGLLGDALAVGFLCYFLRKCRTGFTNTDSTIKTLVMYVVNTGLLTVVAVTVNIVLFGTQRKNFGFVALYMIISKLYANAYLAMLNARESIRERTPDVVSVHLSRLSQSDAGHTGGGGARPFSTATFARARASAMKGARQSQPLSVKIDTSVDVAEGKEAESQKGDLEV